MLLAFVAVVSLFVVVAFASVLDQCLHAGGETTRNSGRCRSGDSLGGRA